MLERVEVAFRAAPDTASVDSLLLEVENGYKFLITEVERAIREHKLTEPDLLTAALVEPAWAYTELAAHALRLGGGKPSSLASAAPAATVAATAGSPGAVAASTTAASPNGGSKPSLRDSFRLSAARMWRSAEAQARQDSPLFPLLLVSAGHATGSMEPLQRALKRSEQLYGASDARVGAVLRVMAAHYLNALGDPVSSEGLYRSALAYTSSAQPFTAACAVQLRLINNEYTQVLLPRLTWNSRSREEEGNKLLSRLTGELRAIFSGHFMEILQTPRQPKSVGDDLFESIRRHAMYIPDWARSFYYFE